MKFVIVGFGRVGMRTAQTLQSEGHEVIVVESDHDKIARAESEGFATVEGDGSNEDVLEAAGLNVADAIAALTGDLNKNFAACMIGKHHGCRTVLRIDEDYREEIYQKYAEDVDEIIYPERLGAAGAKTALLGGDFNVLADITEQLSAASIRIPEGSPAIGKRVIEIDLPADARLYAHGRANEPMTIPLPQTEIRADDSIALISHPDSLAAAREQLRGGSA
ncbi:potassium channel family protein [Halorientalis sp.]|uniref:potassium channel family protein n=1 Tax=Halorientalis sp. TaxID=1931229 RepID=UPI00260AB671|nr:TrkA family potassium uptake protein [Halorientalis sp.]